MLVGQYESKIDIKARLSFPKKFREVLGDKLIVTLGYENSLIIVSEKNWKALLEGTEGRPFIHSETRETQRFLLGSASSIELDAKGRFILPRYLAEFGRIENEVVFIGLWRYVEIWDKKRWSKYRTVLANRIDAISKRLTEDKDKNG